MSLRDEAEKLIRNVTDPMDPHWDGAVAAAEAALLAAERRGEQRGAEKALREAADELPVLRVGGARPDAGIDARAWLRERAAMFRGEQRARRSGEPRCEAEDMGGHPACDSPATLQTKREPRQYYCAKHKTNWHVWSESELEPVASRSGEGQEPLAVDRGAIAYLVSRWRERIKELIPDDHHTMRQGVTAAVYARCADELDAVLARRN